MPPPAVAIQSVSGHCQVSPGEHSCPWLQGGDLELTERARAQSQPALIWNGRVAWSLCCWGTDGGSGLGMGSGCFLNLSGEGIILVRIHSFMRACIRQALELPAHAGPRGSSGEQAALFSHGPGSQSVGPIFEQRKCGDASQGSRAGGGHITWGQLPKEESPRLPAWGSARPWAETRSRNTGGGLGCLCLGCSTYNHRRRSR